METDSIPRSKIVLGGCRVLTAIFDMDFGTNLPKFHEFIEFCISNGAIIHGNLHNKEYLHGKIEWKPAKASRVFTPKNTRVSFRMFMSPSTHREVITMMTLQFNDFITKTNYHEFEHVFK